MYIVPDEVFISRFWARTDRSSGCWLWTGPTLPRGYGQINRHYKKYLAHRYAYILTYGPIPDDIKVCHKCDNPACINPEHLFLGTQADNMQDCKAKGRLPKAETKARGERHWHAKVTEQQVREIRTLVANGSRRPDVARAFGISLSMVDKIVNRNFWQHVE